MTIYGVDTENIVKIRISVVDNEIEICGKEYYNNKTSRGNFEAIPYIWIEDKNPYQRDNIIRHAKKIYDSFRKDLPGRVMISLFFLKDKKVTKAWFEYEHEELTKKSFVLPGVMIFPVREVIVKGALNDPLNQDFKDPPAGYRRVFNKLFTETQPLYIYFSELIYDGEDEFSLIPQEIRSITRHNIFDIIKELAKDVYMYNEYSAQYITPSNNRRFKSAECIYLGMKVEKSFSTVVHSRQKQAHDELLQAFLGRPKHVATLGSYSSPKNYTLEDSFDALLFRFLEASAEERRQLLQRYYYPKRQEELRFIDCLYAIFGRKRIQRWIRLNRLKEVNLITHFQSLTDEELDNVIHQIYLKRILHTISPVTLDRYHLSEECCQIRISCKEH